MNGNARTGAWANAQRGGVPGLEKTLVSREEAEVQGNEKKIEN